MSVMSLTARKGKPLPASRSSKGLKSVSLAADFAALKRTHERILARMRGRRYRRRHRTVLRVREALRRASRSYLYRSGGTYYERRKADPKAKAAWREYQRERRLSIRQGTR